jgi:two-component system, NtrC family, response regulator AtoC
MSEAGGGGAVEERERSTVDGGSAVAAPERVLVVEDDGALAGLLVEELEDAGLAVRSAGTAEEARTMLAEWPADLVVSDIRLPGADGLELLSHVRGLHAAPAFLVITGFGTVRQAVECLKAGADDFLTKPLDLEHLRLSVSRALETRRLRREVMRFRELVARDGFHGMIGRSRAMRVLFDQVRSLARGHGPVLVVGESGVGKELVARAIHAESERSAGPFVAVNCAGIPETLLESEFFGHTKGAFTGAGAARKGLFEEADGGTLLLDEIGEMPASLQAKLLRVLQDGRFRPVGGSRERRVDVRVVAATNQDLESAMREGRFREDLYFRLETFVLRVPPLRERGGDLELLAAHFLQRFSVQLGKPVRGFSADALALIRRHPFPGNVRELQNAVERAVTFADGPTVHVRHLPARARAGAAAGAGPAAPAPPPAGARGARGGAPPGPPHPRR